MTKIRPMANRLLIRYHKKETVTKSGLVLPESSGVTYDKATVVSVGNWIEAGKDMTVPFKAGDTILLDRNQGQKIDEGEDGLFMVRFHSVIAVLED